MKQIEVVAAIIHDDEGRIFATQRGYGDYKDGWEFPGGKMETGETPEEALKREIWEELETRIVVERLEQTVEWDYPKFHLTMHCYRCHVESGSLTLKEHEAARWLTKEQLDSVDWLPADVIVVQTIKKKNTINERGKGFGEYKAKAYGKPFIEAIKLNRLIEMQADINRQIEELRKKMDE